MNIWPVNTNSNEDNGNPNGFLIMLRQNRVATYYQRADDVGNIQNGDLILLRCYFDDVIPLANPAGDLTTKRCEALVKLHASQR
jgi:hypothetical protein